MCILRSLSSTSTYWHMRARLIQSFTAKFSTVPTLDLNLRSVFPFCGLLSTWDVSALFFNNIMEFSVVPTVRALCLHEIVSVLRKTSSSFEVCRIPNVRDLNRSERVNKYPLFFRSTWRPTVVCQRTFSFSFNSEEESCVNNRIWQCRVTYRIGLTCHYQLNMIIVCVNNSEVFWVNLV